MLSDWLEIPNLQQKSKDYLTGLVTRHIFRVKSQQPLPPVGQRLWLFFYGIASTIYRILVGIAIILLVAWQLPVIGVLMALGGVITWLCVPVFKTFKYLALEPELHRKRGRAALFVIACAALVVTLVGLIRFPVHVDAQGILEPEQRAVVNAKVGGFVTDIPATDGQWVKAGQVLLVLRDKELDANVLQLEGNLRALKLKAQQSRNTGDMGEYGIDLLNIDTLTDQLKLFKQQQSDLTIRAPLDGQLIAPDLKNFPGRYVQRGEELLTVATMDRLLIRATLEQRDVALASRLEKPNSGGHLILPQEPEIRLASDIPRIVHGSTPRLINAAMQELPHPAIGQSGGGDVPTDPRDPHGQRAAVDQFELQVDLANPNDLFASGQRAYIRLRVDKRPLIWQWTNRFLQLIETKNASSRWFSI
jgi:putative peptide zinc metalloprotease protein